MAIQQNIFTHSISATSFTIQAGALFITIKNTGSGIVSFIGDSTSGGTQSSSVTLNVGQEITFAQSPTPYPALTIDSSLSDTQIIAVY